MRKKWLLVVAVLFALWLLVIVMEKPSENSLQFHKQQNAIAHPPSKPRTSADDPFVGQWKLNAFKTNFTDQMKVDSAGANRYAFDLNSVYVIQVRPWQEVGLSFIDSLAGETKNVRFDGKDYSRQGPNANPRATTSIRRVNERTLEMTDKVNGKISDTQQITLSPELKSLTITVRTGGSSEPKILVFDRQ